MENLGQEAKKAQKCNNLSDVVDTYFTERVAMLFSKLFIKLNIHPNVVTILSMITGVIGGICFISKNIYVNIVGILLEILAAIFDGSDGQVARLTGKKSYLGRFLDGLADGLVYMSIYIGISINLMTEYIPFTYEKWGYYIWIVSAFCGICFHGNEASIADYYRNVHMFFIANERGNELSRSKHIMEEFKSANSFFNKLRLLMYATFTKSQEMFSPNLQKLLNKIEENGNNVSDKVREEFSLVSNKIVRLTNALTFNLRSYLLFILILCKQTAFIFPFMLIVLEPIKFFLIAKYEKVAKKILKENF